ncbi:nuclear transport factor 2 family protein [Streptosporangium sp. NPDC000396]|uniref:nuclear transport factor 2 family protein n=1 Tax=Streptosporangium sp. NPDC000396 TaxID=3366185 RepID=UPI00368C7327
MNLRSILPASLLVLALAAASGCAGTEKAPDAGAAPAGGASSAAPANPPSAKQGDALATLDPAVKQYVDAVNSKDLDKVVSAFHADGVVSDVGREIKGADAIRAWVDNEVIGGRLDVLENTPREGGNRVLVQFAPGGSGGFRAYYDFQIRDGRIARADLTYA